MTRGSSMEVTVPSPAKINLFLAVTGRRQDGFHDLVSVAAPLDFGDELVARPVTRAAGAQFTLACEDAAVPLDADNLVLRAAAAFAAATGWRQQVHFQLTKRVPVGAGLGGGSSNAVAALRALDQLAGGLLDATSRGRLAATLGSDCSLFLSGGPVVMRGRGERIESLPPAAAGRIHGRRLLLFKPAFGISTPWAYARMVARGTDYLPAVTAEARLADWLRGGESVTALLYNNLESAVFEKYLALPLLLARLHTRFGVAVAMSGSGSTCFALLPDVPDKGGADPGAGIVGEMKSMIRECWGPEIFLQEARLA